MAESLVIANNAKTKEEIGFERLQMSLAASIKAHRTRFDGIMYNGGTVVVLLLTGLVSLYSGKVLDPPWPWWAAALSGAAGLFVALERSLGFGPRWRFHTEMKAGYQTVTDMIDYYKILPEEEKEQRAKVRSEIWQSLNALRNRESSLPSSGGAVTSGGS